MPPHIVQWIVHNACLIIHIHVAVALGTLCLVWPGGPSSTISVGTQNWLTSRLCYSMISAKCPDVAHPCIRQSSLWQTEFMCFFWWCWHHYLQWNFIDIHRSFIVVWRILEIMYFILFHLWGNDSEQDI